MSVTEIKELALERFPRGLILTNQKGEIIYINSTATKILNLDEKDCIGQEFHALLHQGKNKYNQDNTTQCQLLSAFETRQKMTNVSDLFIVNGKKIALEYSFYPLKDEHNNLKGFLLRFRKEMTSTRAENKFLVSLSHELKTPLSIIKSYNQLIKSKLDQSISSQTEKYFEVIDGKVDNLTRLIKRMLDTIKLGKGKLKFSDEVIDFERETKRIIDELQKAIETHQLILTGSTQTKIPMDKERLFQIISNLINNAVKYSPEAKKVDIKLSENETSLQLMIQDYGRGIKKEDADKIFEPFFRSDEDETSGLGMGLFHTKQIVNYYSGEIWFVTDPGQGTRFYVNFPKSNDF
jgi:signal transduction histidine kinase